MAQCENDSSKVARDSKSKISFLKSKLERAIQKIVSSESLERFHTEYQAGRYAFERGQYREAVQHLREAHQCVDRNSSIGGEVLIWLLGAYQALGESAEAIALCKNLTRHPSIEIRKQAKRLLFILEAPQLNTRPEWLIEIPDMSALDEGNSKVSQITAKATAKPPKRKRPEAEMPVVDLAQVNAKDNGFVWVAILAIALLLGSLVWFS